MRPLGDINGCPLTIRSAPPRAYLGLLGEQSELQLSERLSEEVAKPRSIKLCTNDRSADLVLPSLPSRTILTLLRPLIQEQRTEGRRSIAYQTQTIS